MKFKPYTYTFNFITHILVHLVIVNTLEQSCTLDMSVKIKCIIIIIITSGCNGINFSSDNVIVKCIIPFYDIHCLCYSGLLMLLLLFIKCKIIK